MIQPEKVGFLEKKGDFFDIYGPPMKTYCEEVSANWDKSEDEIKPKDKQKKLEQQSEISFKNFLDNYLNS